MKAMSRVGLAAVMAGITAGAYAVGGGTAASSSAALDSARAEEERSASEPGKKGSKPSPFFTTDFTDVATLPAFSIAAPSGMVPSWGTVFASYGGTTNTAGSGDYDGAFAIGAGFGDAQESVGGALNVGIGSVNPNDGGQLERGNFDISFGHFFTETLTSVAVGGIDLGGWHAGGGRNDPSYYASVTQIWPNDVAPVIFNAGIGSNNFTFLRSTVQNRSRNIGLFGSASIYVLPQASIVLDYTSGISTAGVSLVPIASLPVTVNLAAYDMFKYAPQHDEVSFLASITYAYTF